MTSLRTRLLVSVLAMVAVVALALGGVTYRGVLGETEALFDYQLRQMALSLRDQGEIATNQANALRDEQLDFVVQIWTVDGRSIYASRKHEFLPGRVVMGFADVAVAGATWRTFSVAARDRVIQVAQPVRIRKALAAEAALRSVIPLLVLAPVMALVMGVLVTLSLRPLRRLAREVRERDADSLEPLPPADLPDELEPLVSALNALLARASTLFDAQRAFVSDAAHELRSPLTALKLQVRALRTSGDEAQRQAAVEGVSAGVERAARLVEQLLTLARSEPGATEAPLQTLDLSELVREAVARTVPYALSREASFELLADEPVMVEGDANALTAMARNLADNAVRYGPVGGEVVVTVKQADGAALLRVDDGGPGIPADERERVFDRFYRREQANPHGEQGTGLGLAIVRTVAQRHGAQVMLGESPAGGLRVEVRFPPGRDLRIA
jgi:two-component system OmpR family sensor kinase/two-component system sensor histidine kinase QseC